MIPLKAASSVSNGQTFIYDILSKLFQRINVSYIVNHGVYLEESNSFLFRRHDADNNAELQLFLLLCTTGKNPIFTVSRVLLGRVEILF